MRELSIGDICKVKSGVYQDVIVKITRLPDKKDKRYSVSRDRYGGLRFEREELEFIEENKS
jgi:hypothetical protein